MLYRPTLLLIISFHHLCHSQWSLSQCQLVFPGKSRDPRHSWRVAIMFQVESWKRQKRMCDGYVSKTFPSNLRGHNVSKIGPFCFFPHRSGSCSQTEVMVFLPTDKQDRGFSSRVISTSFKNDLLLWTDQHQGTVLLQSWLLPQFHRSLETEITKLLFVNYITN